MNLRTNEVRIVLADDHPVVLGGLEMLLKLPGNLRVVATAPDGEAALLKIREHEPDLAILDINMPHMTGVDVLETLEGDGLGTRVILLTASASDAHIERAVTSGAWGLMLKDSAADALLECVQTVCGGERWLPDELVGPALAREEKRRTDSQALERALTPREIELARLVAAGLANKQIARQVNISEGTVKIHLHNIYQKLGVTNRTSLATLAQRSLAAPT